METDREVHLRMVVQQFLLPMLQGTFQGDSKTRDILSGLCDSIKTILSEERYRDFLRDPILYQDQILEILKIIIASDKTLRRTVIDLTNSVSRKQEAHSTARQSITVNGDGNQTIVAGRDLIAPRNTLHSVSDIPKKSRLNEAFSRRMPEVRQIDLHLDTLGSGGFKIHCINHLSGEVIVESNLPYNSDDLDAVLELLEYMDRDLFRLRKLQMTYQRLGLLEEDRFSPAAFQKIGQQLYQSLFPPKVDAALMAVINQARMQNGHILLRLHFPEKDNFLCRFPWELLHNGDRFLIGDGFVELARHLEFSEAYSVMRTPPPWHLLYIAPRPKDRSVLPDEQDVRQIITGGLQPLIQEGMLRVEILKSLKSCWGRKLREVRSAYSGHSPRWVYGI